MARYMRALLALSTLVVTVSSAATPYRRAQELPRQDGWPSEVSSDVVGSSDPTFATLSARWSSYKAPTFTQVFVPKDEDDLASGVRKTFFFFFYEVYNPLLKWT